MVSAKDFTMKNLIPWVVVVLLGSGVYFLFGANRAKDVELARLRETAIEVDKLRQDSEQLKKLPELEAEIEGYKKDNADLLRLRAEVAKLRTQAKELNAKLLGAQAMGDKALATIQELAEKMSQQANQAAAVPQSSADLTVTPGVPATTEDTCILSLRMLDAAKQQWGLENKKGPDAVPIMADLLPYLANKTVPKCPNGGVYELNPLQAPVTCTIEGHTLTPK